MVDHNAVPADPWPGIENVHPGMPIGEGDHLPHVEPHSVGDHGEFVGEGDVDVEIGILDQLGHLGRAGIGSDARVAHEALVEGERLSRGVIPPIERSFAASSSRMRPGSKRSGQ